MKGVQKSHSSGDLAVFGGGGEALKEVWDSDPKASLEAR